MLFSRVELFYVASALFSTALGQTFTSCNPLEKTCPKDEALGKTYTHNFATGGASDLFTATGSAAKIKYTSDGMVLPVAVSGDSPTITSNFYIFWGKVDIVMKCAPGQGIISSLVLESDDLDEIDYEWVGSETGKVQSNYFGKGDTTSYDRGASFAITSPATTFYTYSIEWTKDHIIWYINGVVQRTLLPNQVTASPVHSDLYPQTPMQIKIGSWSGGDPANAPGTIQWAGGETNYGAGPYNMVVQSINIQDYSVGATSYTYGDMTGSAASIIISKDGTSDITNSAVSSAAAAPSSTPSSAASSGKPSTTLATSTSSAKPSQTSTSTSTAVPTNLAGMIVAGLPGSIGSYGQNEAVVNGTSSSVTSSATTSVASKTSIATSATSTGSSTATGAPAATGGAGTINTAGLGSMLMGVAALAAFL